MKMVLQESKQLGRMLSIMPVAGLTYYVVFVLSWYAHLWIKLQLQLSGAYGERAEGLHGWFAMEIAWLPVGLLPWVAVHLLTLVLLFLSRPQLGRTWYYPVAASVIGAFVCAVTIAILNLAILGPDGVDQPSFWVAVFVWLVGVGSLATYAGVFLVERFTGSR